VFSKPISFGTTYTNTYPTKVVYRVFQHDTVGEDLRHFFWRQLAAEYAYEIINSKMMQDEVLSIYVYLAPSSIPRILEICHTPHPQAICIKCPAIGKRRRRLHSHSPYRDEVIGGVR
jgi:hypothetical protein